MAKKKNKKDKKASASSDPVEAIRAAVERTFHATTDSAAGTQKRTRQLVDEVSHAAARVRTAIEELRVLDEVKGLRNDIEALGRRVAALESSGAAKPAASRGAASRPAASRSTAATRSRSTRAASTRAKASGTSARKSTASTSRAKPRTTGSSASTRSRSPRASGGGSSS
jgi:predicted  nucleic acid-binding Zn-ribbon protein